MKITFISDTHTRQRNLTLEGGDILIFAGDAMSTGYYPQELTEFIDWFKAQPYKYKVAIAGNHDRYCESFPQYQVRDMFERYYDDGVRYVCDEEITVEGLRIYGTPYQPFFCDWAFNVPDSDRLSTIYNNIPEGLDILITHCPPYDILDKSHLPRPRFGTNGEEPLGSKELLNRLDMMEQPPKINVFGHIHGDGGKIIEEGGTKFINASVCDEAYKVVNNGVTILYGE